MRSRRRFLITAGLAAVLAGCGSGGPATAPSAPASATASPLPSTTTTTTTAADEAAVREAFAAEREAALAKDGDTAVQHLAGTANGFYDAARRDARAAGEEQVRGSTVAVQLTVFTMRGSLAPELLRSASPSGLIEAAVDAGLVGEDNIATTELGTVRVIGDAAFAEAVSRGTPTSFQFSFRREDGRWRLDLVPLLETTNAVFTQLAAQQGKTVDQLVDDLLVTLYGPTKARQVLEPIGE